MQNRRNYYRILQVQPGAPVEVIRASYRTLMQRLRLHPDLGGSHRHAALINEAYAVLSNPERRARYDRELDERLRSGRRQAAKPSAPGPGDRGIGPATADDGCLFCGAAQPESWRMHPDARCLHCGSPLAARPPCGPAGKDQRLAGRVSKNQALQVFSHWPGTPIAARSRDISPAGISLVAARPFPPRSILKLAAADWDAVAQVINTRREAQRDAAWIIGARFLGVIFRHSRGTFFSGEA